VYEPDGSYIGQVLLPEGRRVIAMRGDFVWAAVTDANDVPMVKRWRIAWR
jgi:hypothetical protein